MAELKTLVCPKCGAVVPLERAAERATCKYCGAVAYVDNPRRVEPLPSPPRRGLNPAQRAAIIGFGILVLVSAVAVVTLVTRAPEPARAPVALDRPPSSDVFKGLPRALEPPLKPAAVVRLQVQSYALARLVDSDGDKVDELLLPIAQTREHATTSHFAVFDARDGKLRKQTPAIESVGDALLTAVAYGRLVLAQPNGQVTGYDLASGDSQWSTALGERVAALCMADPRATDSLHVTTDDGRNLLLDVKTGRQSPTRSDCKVPLAVSLGRHAPSDRRDYRAPLGTEAWLCGGVRVMGSDNYSVPDACRQRARIDTDRLDGMIGHSLWHVGVEAPSRAREQTTTWLVLGIRKPGSYVPAVGLLARGNWVWKSEVPAANPLDAETGGPRFVSLLGDSLVLGYRDTKSRHSWVTRFDLRDGTRRWSQDLGEPGLVTLVQNQTVLVVQSEHAARLLSPETGALVATIGAE